MSSSAAGLSDHAGAPGHGSATPPPTAPADTPPVGSRRQTAENVSQITTNPAFANPHVQVEQPSYVQVEQPSGEIELGTLDRTAANDPPDRTVANDPLDRTAANDPPKAAEAKDDLVAQRARLRRLLQEHTNMTPKQINKTLKGVDKDVTSITKAIENKYGVGNIPSEVLREIVDLVKSYIKNLEEIAKGFKDLLSASAAR